MRRLVVGSTLSDPQSTTLYTLRGLVGRGAASVVYRAEPGPVALKVVEGSERDRAVDEAQLLASLAGSDHIVQLRSFFDDGRRAVLVLEWFEHGSLAKQMRAHGALNETVVRSVLRQVLTALRIVHARGLIHRDVKAANVLVDAGSGRCALADFGLAAAAGAATETVGTPFWLAPEVITTQQAVPVSDVWSVGCLAIECLTATPPYFEIGPMAALHSMVKDEMPPLPPNASPAATAFLRRCFVRDVDVRPAAAVLLDDSWLADAPQVPLDALAFTTTAADEPTKSSVAPAGQ